MNKVSLGNHKLVKSRAGKGEDPLIAPLVFSVSIVNCSNLFYEESDHFLKNREEQSLKRFTELEKWLPGSMLCPTTMVFPRI